MKKKLIIIASVLLASAALAELVASNGVDEVRLFDRPCSADAVLARLSPVLRARMLDATATIGGVPYHACWVRDGGSAHLLYEDGDQGLIPMTDFREQPRT